MSKHDDIILEVKKSLEEKGYSVKVNLEEKKENEINLNNGETIFPDLYTYNNDDMVISIYEVETEETVTQEKANTWEKYSKVNAAFYLVVPTTKLEIAKTIVKDKNIVVKGFWSF